MVSSRRKLGDLGEQIALNYLRKNKYRILERNWSKKWGEIDIIAVKNDNLVFFEVKTRDSYKAGEYASPEENVNWQKQRRLLKTAKFYLLAKNYPADTSWQIDIIAIELDFQSRRAKLRHLKRAVWD